MGKAGFWKTDKGDRQQPALSRESALSRSARSQRTHGSVSVTREVRRGEGTWERGQVCFLQEKGLEGWVEEDLGTLLEYVFSLTKMLPDHSSVSHSNGRSWGLKEGCELRLRDLKWWGR